MQPPNRYGSEREHEWQDDRRVDHSGLCGIPTGGPFVEELSVLGRWSRPSKVFQRRIADVAAIGEVLACEHPNGSKTEERSKDCRHQEGSESLLAHQPIMPDQLEVTPGREACAPGASPTAAGLVEDRGGSVEHLRPHRF